MFVYLLVLFCFGCEKITKQKITPLCLARLVVYITSSSNLELDKSYIIHILYVDLWGESSCYDLFEYENIDYNIYSCIYF